MKKLNEHKRVEVELKLAEEIEKIKALAIEAAPEVHFCVGITPNWEVYSWKYLGNYICPDTIYSGVDKRVCSLDGLNDGWDAFADEQCYFDGKKDIYGYKGLLMYARDAQRDGALGEIPPIRVDFDNESDASEYFWGIPELEKWFANEYSEFVFENDDCPEAEAERIVDELLKYAD